MLESPAADSHRASALQSASPAGLSLQRRMTEYAGEKDEEGVSAFIVGTWQFMQRTSQSSLAYSDHMLNLMPSINRPLVEDYSVVCGSLAESYIRPIISCIEDMDFLVAQTGELVFSGEFPVLPSDLSGLADKIKCYKVRPYVRYPGFVRLEYWGEMNYNWKNKRYEFNYSTTTNNYFARLLNIVSSMYCPAALNISTTLNTIIGPAVKQRIDAHTWFINDIVSSLWCPHWPKEAQGWLNRPRLSGWPTYDIISEVVQHGCHMVYIQHRSCRNEFLQWRFSFSLAEVILLQSWTKTQQIVYHLLRFFAKRELIRKDCPKEDEVLCTYHLKTLMLWTCEEMFPQWWNSSSVIDICYELLKILAEWLKKRHCPNYFIPEANLFYDPSSPKALEKTERRLNELWNSGILCHWFMANYVQPSIRRHFKPMETIPHLVDYKLSLLKVWNRYTTLEFYFYNTFSYAYTTCRYIMKQGLNSGVRNSLKNVHMYRSFQLIANSRMADLPAITTVSCFTYYDILLHILHTAYGLGCGEITWDGSLFVESLNAFSMQPKIVRSKYHNFSKACPVKISRFHFHFRSAKFLMENLTGSNSRPEFKLLSLVTKEFLRKALEHDDATLISNGSVSAALLHLAASECDDSQSSGIVPSALACLAALHFASSEYHEAARLCSAVFMGQTSKENKESLNAGCLLFIDDVARIVGLCLLQKKITENNLYYANRRLYLDLRLSPEVFAQYILVLSAVRMPKQSLYYNDLSDSSFPMDVNLKALIKPKCIFSMNSAVQSNALRQIAYRRPNSLTETEASSMNISTFKERVLDALVEYGLENITIFYNVIRKDFGVNCNTADCYRALFLYTCRQYYQVLSLCERILKDSDLEKKLEGASFANVLLLPPLDTFFEKDVQSLLGFHTLFHYLSPLNDDLGKIELAVESKFKHLFAHYVYLNKRCLSNFLQGHYYIRCQYILGRHFLARYLRLKCCIDCKLSYSEELNEFAVHRPSLPFEHIIRRFILRKLHI